jgi:hypothetical protein
MRRYPLVCYFLLTFGLTWAFELLALLLWHVNYYGPWMAPAFFGPTLSALLLTAILEGKADVGRLLRGYVRWRVDLRWYLLVLLSALTVPGVGRYLSCSRSSLSAHLPAVLSRPPCLQWSARRGSRLARVRPTPLATALWPAGRNAHPRVAVGPVAPAPRPVRPRVHTLHTCYLK